MGALSNKGGTSKKNSRLMSCVNWLKSKVEHSDSNRFSDLKPKRAAQRVTKTSKTAFPSFRLDNFILDLGAQSLSLKSTEGQQKTDLKWH